MADYPSRCGADACKNLNYTCTGNEFSKPCVCGNKFLGPKDLKPNNPALEQVFATYKALNNTCPDVYLKSWTTWTYPPKNPRDKYPNNNGFEGSPKKGSPKIGDIVDRFGSWNGKYLAPALTPFVRRSTPLGNLVPRSKSNLDNYWAYRVNGTLNAQEGKIAPFYGQPGCGTQWYVNETLDRLVKNGTLIPVKPSGSGSHIEWKAASVPQGNCH